MEHFGRFSNSANLSAARCPVCGQRTFSADPAQIPALVGLTPAEEAILDTVLQCATIGDGYASFSEIFAAVYADDPDGGPDTSGIYRALKGPLASLLEKIEPFGLSISCKDRRGCRLSLLPASEKTSPPAIQRRPPATCWCCSQLVFNPPIEIVAAQREVQPREWALLLELRRWKGKPIPNERLHNVVFRDRAVDDWYNAFKTAVSNIRRKLRDSGFAIVNAGYGCGYMLVEEVVP